MIRSRFTDVLLKRQQGDAKIANGFDRSNIGCRHESIDQKVTAECATGFAGVGIGLILERPCSGLTSDTRIINVDYRC